MGVFSAYHKLKEYLKIYRFKFGEGLSRHEIFWELIKRRWKSLFALSGLIIICSILDVLFSRFLAPVIADQPWYKLLTSYVQFPNTQIIISVLGAIISGVAAVIGLLLAISLVVLELAANRYPYRMVRFLVEEKVGEYIIDLLVMTLLFSLWTLFPLQRGTIVPYVSILVCLLLASFSIVFLFVYRNYSLYFFQPSQGFQAVSSEVRKSIYAVFEKGARLGRSVTNYMQERVQERIFLIQDFINVLMDKKDPEAAHGLTAISSIVSLYIAGKRFIDIQGGWYPLREVPVTKKDYVSLQLTQPFEEFALGARMEKEPDTDWLERQVLNVIEVAQRKAIEKDDRMCLIAIILGYREIIENCLEHQEFSILDRVMERVLEFGVETSLKSYPEVMSEFYNLILFIVEKSIRGSDLKSLRDVVRKVSWLSDEEVISLKLPKMFNEELLLYRRKLETELAIEGRIVTPPDWIENEIMDKVSKSDADLSRKYYKEALRIVSNVNERISSEKRYHEIRNLLVAQLLVLRRALVLGSTVLVSENIDEVLEQVLKSYEHLATERDLRLDVFKELKLGCLNSIKRRDEKSLSKFFESLCVASAQELRRKDSLILKEILESLLVVASLAFLDSEFYTGSKSFEIVEGLIFKYFDARKLIMSFEIMTRRYDPRLALEYHNWFKDIMMKISGLPIVEKKREGVKALAFVHEHPSEFIQRYDHVGIIECARAMIQELTDKVRQSMDQEGLKKKNAEQETLGGRKSQGQNERILRSR